jgi:hypothetical protein
MEPALSKVTLEYEDGSKRWLAGADAKQWSDEINSIIGCAFIHGQELSDIQWQKEKRQSNPKSPCLNFSRMFQFSNSMPIKKSMKIKPKEFLSCLTCLGLR